MKILLLTQNINEQVLQAGLAQVKQLLASINFPAQFTEKKTTTVFKSVPYVDTSDYKGFQLDPNQILAEEKIFGDFDLDCLVYDPSIYTPRPTNPTDNGEAMQIPSNWFGEYPASFAFYFLHELCHFCFWKYGGRDITHEFYTSPFASKPNGTIDFYLSILQSFVPKIKLSNIPVSNIITYKYFKPSEVVGLKPELVKLLDKIRGEYGFPLKITSGLRTQSQNEALQGSVSDSAHLTGFACDLAINDSLKRFKLVSVVLNNGITRIGIGKDFLHLDIAPNKIKNVLWTYY